MHRVELVELVDQAPSPLPHRCVRFVQCRLRLRTSCAVRVAETHHARGASPPKTTEHMFTRSHVHGYGSSWRSSAAGGACRLPGLVCVSLCSQGVSPVLAFTALSELFSDLLFREMPYSMRLNTIDADILKNSS